jgi:DNA polymerase III alpha subunit
MTEQQARAIVHLNVAGFAAAVERIIAERARGGPYAGLEDFCARVGPGDDEARALIHAHALDSPHAGADHAELIWRLAG